MKIVIVGAGSVGAAICAQLASEGHDITIVDRDIAAINEISNVYDVAGVGGNGADVSVLRKAGAERADLLIAVASEDEINILCCAAAKKLGTKNTVARVRNPEYSGLMQLMKNEMSLSLTINPEYTAAKEIYRMLRLPSAAKVDTFCRGRVELVEFAVASDSPICEKSLNDLRSKFNIRFLVCSVMRGDEVHIPSGNFVIKAGDVISVTAPEAEITSFFKAIGAYKEPVRDVLIVGGGRTTYYLEGLLKQSRINSTVIEKDPELCQDLAEQYSCTVICDHGTKQNLLLEEGIERTDAFLALSSEDDENAIVSLYAKTKNVKKIVTMISSMSFVDLFKGAGLESIVSPKSSMASVILRYVRSMANTRDSEIESLHKIMDGSVEALEFAVKDEIDGITGVPLKSLRSREGVLIACIVHGDSVIIPSGDDKIRSGDTVIVIATSGQMNNIKDILKR